MFLKWGRLLLLFNNLCHVEGFGGFLLSLGRGEVVINVFINILGEIVKISFLIDEFSILRRPLVVVGHTS